MKTFQRLDAIYSHLCRTHMFYLFFFLQKYCIYSHFLQFYYYHYYCISVDVYLSIYKYFILLIQSSNSILMKNKIYLRFNNKRKTKRARKDKPSHADGINIRLGPVLFGCHSLVSTYAVLIFSLVFLFFIAPQPLPFTSHSDVSVKIAKILSNRNQLFLMI